MTTALERVLAAAAAFTPPVPLTPPPTPTVGGIYTFPETASVGIQWVVMTAPREGFVYVAALDEETKLVGSLDVAHGRDVIRMVRIVLPVAAFENVVYSGELSGVFLDRAKARFRAFIDDGVDANPHQRRVEEDPDYAAWMDLLDDCVDAIKAAYFPELDSEE